MGRGGECIWKVADAESDISIVVMLVGISEEKIHFSHQNIIYSFIMAQILKDVTEIEQELKTDSDEEVVSDSESYAKFSLEQWKGLTMNCAWIILSPLWIYVMTCRQEL